MNKAESDTMNICGQSVKAGETTRIHLEVARLYDFTPMFMPIEVIRGTDPGPTLFISGAIHGDEINGVEIIRRIINKKNIGEIKGTLLAVPVVNIFGFNDRSRYLPDRRDLNRCFPGSKDGSLGARIAQTFMKEVVGKCTHGIDLHSGAVHRKNLPQVRACISDSQTKRLAMSFGAPVVLNSRLRDGSLREAARKRKIPMLIFEGGEALRFDEKVIQMGVKGCLSVMQSIGMLPQKLPAEKKPETFIAEGSFWVRAPSSGSLRLLKKLGDRVRIGDRLAIIQDLFGKRKVFVESEEEGLVIGITQFPLVNRGDAVFHVATFKNLSKISNQLDRMDLDFID